MPLARPTPLCRAALVLAGCLAVALPTARAADEARPEIRDLSLLVATDMPCTWPSNYWPLYQINPYRRIGARSAYNSEILTIDGNTGTQLDFPPHSVAPPDSGKPQAAPSGTMFSEKAPAWQFGGEACVVDVRDLRDNAPNGRSALIKRDHVKAWEAKHRPVGPGDVVLFASGYTDAYYKPLLAGGRRFVAEPVDGSAPAWPDPEPDCMEYLGSRKVMTLGTDSASMGPLPDLAEPTHYAGLKHGMMWTESATGLIHLPPTGAYYCCMGPKHAHGPYTEGRAFAVLGDLAKWLIDETRKKKVADLSVTLDPDLPVWWPGAGAGNHRHPYMLVRFSAIKNTGGTQQTHIMDSHTGTHLVPPSYALPRKGFDNREYAPEVREWLEAYEKKHGPRGTTDVTADKVPLDQTCGWARVIDVRHKVGTTDRRSWPASPEITVADIQQYEKSHGELHAGDVVIFSSGYSDQYLKPFPEGDRCLADPLNGKAEGWPAPGPDAVLYLADKGIRCVATDGPTLGGVDPKQALMTYWALGSNGIAGVEYQTNVHALPAKAFFMFAGLKIRGCHGGPGRAIAVY